MTCTKPAVVLVWMGFCLAGTHNDGAAVAIVTTAPLVENAKATPEVRCDTCETTGIEKDNLLEMRENKADRLLSEREKDTRLSKKAEDKETKTAMGKEETNQVKKKEAEEKDGTDDSADDVDENIEGNEPEQDEEQNEEDMLFAAPLKPCTITVHEEDACQGNSKNFTALTFSDQVHDWRHEASLEGATWRSARLSETCLKAVFVSMSSNFKKNRCHGVYCKEWCNSDKFLGCGWHTALAFQGFHHEPYTLTCHCGLCNGCPLRLHKPLLQDDGQLDVTPVSYADSEEDQGCADLSAPIVGFHMVPRKQCPYFECPENSKIDQRLSCSNKCDEKQCCRKYWTCATSNLKCPKGLMVNVDDDSVQCFSGKCSRKKCCVEQTCSDFCTKLNFPLASGKEDTTCGAGCSKDTCCQSATITNMNMCASLVVITVSLLRSLWLS